MTIMTSSKFFVFLLFFGFALIVEAAVFIQRQKENPEHPGQCRSLDDNTYHFIGEEFHDTEKCIKYICSSGEGGIGSERQLYLTGQSCGTMAVSPPCEIEPGKKGLPYPECCPTVRCLSNLIDDN